jgi:hypothetical protein
VIRRRRGPIAGWAVLDLALGVPSKLIGSWTVNQLAVLLLGFGWSLLSFFAIPTIALTGGSPKATARRSLQLVRRHWGDAIYSTATSGCARRSCSAHPPPSPSRSGCC